MEKGKIALIVLPMFVIALLGVFVISFSVPFSQPEMSNGIQYYGTVCTSTTGDFEGRESPASQGIMELVECDHNIVVDDGLNAIRDILSGGGAPVQAFDYIALCNATLGGGENGCAAPVAGDSALTSEFAASGLSRTQGTYGVQPGAGNWSLYTTFTSTSDSVLTNVTGLFNSSSVADSTMLAANTFTLVTLQNNDQLTVNWTIYVTN